jgi:hypothetical protein
MSSQELRNHEMAHVLIGPISQMTSNTSKEGDVERLYSNVSIKTIKP